ncbi:MAG: leucine--tRNA ligase [Bacteroidales bacterium]|nr:leucine--tRNA ligase [Bacteroidales bacterium]
MEYKFNEIETKWQKYWEEQKIFEVSHHSNKPKYYVLDMFPYPSGAGLHVGHPLGYIASDIVTRYMKHKGYNVLHPMGFDAFGLPAEQYAIQTGQHPAITTEKNIQRYKQQLKQIGFAYDWSREIRTCDPSYYKWTQWTFIQLFKHWFNTHKQKAEPVETLIELFEQKGNSEVPAAHHCDITFTAQEWKNFSEKTKQQILLKYRLAYLDETFVNWCPALGTVLANDEVKDGLSVRGGHPVEQKKMKQWFLRVSAYAERLLEGLDRIDWSDSLKEMQRNWIGKSEGAEILFHIKNFDKPLRIFTTRPDTIFGCTFMVLAPEHEFVVDITSEEYKSSVLNYIEQTKKRTERDRISDVTHVSGCFTGAYAIHPFTKEEIPIWISDYVLISYGTGAIMAVPAHDSRDFAFAKHFNLPIIQVIQNPNEQKNSDITTWSESYDSKEGICINSDFINGLEVKEAIKRVIEKVTELKIGTYKVNYRIRDAIFSRQRYWGEPFPIYYKDDIPYPLNDNELPLELPTMDSFMPTSDGKPPLARLQNWKNADGFPLETSTMPGFAGSSGYYFRYMDPHNHYEYFSKDAVNYWKEVDLYIGGTEHATGHLIYARFWCKFLFDIGLSPIDEPFKKLVNQGMIQGRSNFVYRIKGTNTFVSKGLKEHYDVQEIHVDINLVKNDILDIEAFKQWQPEFENAEFILENGKYICGWAIEKMSKSMYNVVNPDDIVAQYGADTLRMYEMFLGPIEQSKPWDTHGIEGVHRFLKKVWRLFVGNDGKLILTDEQPTFHELKLLHKLIKKINEDIQSFSFNTAVSAFMIFVNELNEHKCHKKSILLPFLVCLSPFAPHICEELWHLCGHQTSIANEPFPNYDEKLTFDDTKTYPVSFNGKMRFQIELPMNATPEELQQAVLKDDRTSKWLEGKQPKKIVAIPGKIINIVV